MRPDFDSPQYWKSLYQRPAESSTQGVTAGSADLEEGDLDAVLAPDALEAHGAGGPAVDAAQVTALVESLVEQRIQALLAQGWGPNAGSAPRTPARPAAPPTPQARPAAPPTPTPRATPAAKPPQPAPKPTPRQPRPAAQAAPPPKPAPAPKPAAKPGGGVGAAMWERVPNLPNGQAALFGAEELGYEAIQLLVMVDGITNLRGLRTLAPQIDDQTFLGIIRAGIKAGILELT